jgi:hypothetical protein
MFASGAVWRAAGAGDHSTLLQVFREWRHDWFPFPLPATGLGVLMRGEPDTQLCSAARNGVDVGHLCRDARRRRQHAVWAHWEARRDWW